MNCGYQGRAPVMERRTRTENQVIFIIGFRFAGSAGGRDSCIIALSYDTSRRVAEKVFDHCGTLIVIFGKGRLYQSMEALVVGGHLNLSRVYWIRTEEEYAYRRCKGILE